MTDPAAIPSEPRSTAPTEADYEEWVRIDPGAFVKGIRLATHWIWDHVYRLKSYRADRIPEEGPLLLVPNHASYADPFLQIRGQHRLVRFMAKSQLFDMPVIKHIVRAGGGFPVRRGRGDMFAMSLAKRMLQEGQPVVVYAEGTRYRDSLELGPAKSGAARLALETGVPVVPIASWGTKRRELYGLSKWQRRTVTTLYGEVMHFEGVEPTPENVERVRDEIWAAVSALYEEVRELAAAR
ncbi:MAG: 1-acylglycerol-3-phosphate O-acyltransferase [Thermoleophilia bacterium]|nr:1-acylglycerol-3-phosphate O-acyltransferase [Thermoleophilia bacterium]